MPDISNILFLSCSSNLSPLPPFFLTLQCLSSLLNYKLQKEKKHIDFGLCCAPQVLSTGPSV